MFIVGIPLTQQPPGRGETSAACGMAQVLRAKGSIWLCFMQGLGNWVPVSFGVSGSSPCLTYIYIILPTWLFDIAMENSPFIDLYIDIYR